MTKLVLSHGKAPCMGCGKRHVGCHSSCPLYIQYVEERERERKERLIACDVTGVLNRGLNKWRIEQIKKGRK